MSWIGVGVLLVVVAALVRAVVVRERRLRIVHKRLRDLNGKIEGK